jgi:pimeloyl-ACP methyl ester carboxylesterase
MFAETLSPYTQPIQPTGWRQFPVGYYALHPDVSLNFQMNRWYSWTNDQGMLDEMRTVAPQIRNYADVKRVFVELSKKAMTENLALRSAFYLRMAEFFMFADDPDKFSTRNRFVSLMVDEYQVSGSSKYLIPFQNGKLVAYRFTPEEPKGTLVVFGGFDSYVEEFFPILFSIRDAGYDVVCFEGPGQGAVLEDYHIPMMPEWGIPVKAVLDYFELEDVTLIGLSLGGYLVLRAAAYEPRVWRAVAWDVMEDTFECLLSQLSPGARGACKLLIRSGASGLANSLLKAAMRSSLLREWGVKQGMHVFGVKTPYNMLREADRYHTHEISSLIRQDVLLLAGAEDHYVPLRFFYDQIRSLTHVRSLTARLFTREEQAQNHCQVGNIGLVIEFVLNWVEQIQRHTS